MKLSMSITIMIILFETAGGVINKLRNNGRGYDYWDWVCTRCKQWRLMTVAVLIIGTEFVPVKRCNQLNYEATRSKAGNLKCTTIMTRDDKYL